MIKRLLFAFVCCASLLIAAQPTSAASQQAGCTGSLGSQTCPIRLRFARGTYGVLANGSLPSTPTQRYYVINARKGQPMFISFAGAGPMRGGIKFPGGGGDGPYNGVGTLYSLPASGDYVIYVGPNTMAGNPWSGRFTLSVVIGPVTN